MLACVCIQKLEFNLGIMPHCPSVAGWLVGLLVCSFSLLSFYVCWGRREKDRETDRSLTSLEPQLSTCLHLSRAKITKAFFLLASCPAFLVLFLICFLVIDFRLSDLQGKYSIFSSPRLCFHC